MSSLERRTGIALWRQIADDIRAAIGNGAYEDTGKLPTEAALATQFGVNRHTVRAALAALARDGMIDTTQGRGSFVVARKRLSYPIGPRTRFSAGLEGQVARTRSRALESRIEPASAPVAEALHLAPEAPVLRLDMLGEADDTPLSRATHWFEASRFAHLPDHYRAFGSITRALAACGVEDYVRLFTDITAAPASAADRQDLDLQPGAVVLLTLSVNGEVGGGPVQYSRSRFSADRVTLSVRMPGGL
ncbi:phosphonate metabolism transcriptional regulator PhnF [Stappia indica]|uniref:phosphonate metabolism transcriptional regulator PhnF n=1 Tax=Stappia indica TaxID=538381 RepID=UPI001CD53456|nr:phosphonate metabolism transcriptional regulator PhnF [Stappia indica]MCA1299382.1 phosphonate metabolism transcriptional regulator PhnF [Stappia indica]